MSLIQQIKDEHLQARKDKSNVKASLLTTMLGDLQRVAKDSGRPSAQVSDSEVLQVVKKFIKGAEETLVLVPDSELAAAEKEILTKYLPAQLSAEALVNAIHKILATIEAPSAKSLGLIMKELKTNYDNQYDSKQATLIIKGILDA